MVLLYQADDSSLEKWTSRGILFRHPDRERVSVECANIFKAGDEWVLLLSTHKLVEYFIGRFDPAAGTFIPRTSGLLDASDQFYATNLLMDDRQRQVCFGWLRGFAPGRGWNGCLSLPRILTIEDGQLRQVPVPEIEQLRQSPFHTAGISLGEYSVPGFESSGFEVGAQITSEEETIFGVKLVPVDKRAQTVVLTCSPTEACLNDKIVVYQHNRESEIRLFMDRSVIEVFIDNHASLTLVLQSVASLYRVVVFADRSSTVLRQFDVWEMADVSDKS